MKTFRHPWAAAAAILVLGLSGMQPVQGQPYGYRPPPYPAPAYPGRYPQPQQKASAAETRASVDILAPQDGAAVSRSESLMLEYDVVPGPKGDHVHVYVDGREVAILRELKGRYEVGRLRPGRHELAIKVVNRAHVPIGVESSVQVTVQ